MAGKTNQPRILSVKIPFKNEGKIKTFSDKQELKDFIAADIHYKNAKGSSSGWREVIPDENSHFQDGIEDMAIGKYVDK